jgi:ribonuclease-3
VPEAPGADELAARLRPFLGDEALLRVALTHRSRSAESPGEESNERLEFLGDAVLSLVVAEHCYRADPALPEGDLARIRAAVVSTEALAPVAASLGVGAAVRLGKGEAASGGRAKASILADTLEALFGAVYLDSGLESARSFVLMLLAPAIEAVMRRNELGDAKNRLQELAARRGEDPPRYLVRSSGPEHARWFAAEVYLGDRLVGEGRGRSKKQAEREAAASACDALGPAMPPAVKPRSAPSPDAGPAPKAELLPEAEQLPKAELLPEAGPVPEAGHLAGRHRA